MSDLLVIVPSRGRPESVKPLADDFYNNGSGKADLLFALDDDDVSNYHADDTRVGFRVGPRLRMCGTLNAVAVEQAPNYKYVGFLGDDHRPRTVGWDEKVIDALESHNIVYGNDLLQGENLPTAVFMRSEIIQKLGFMAPRELIHLYLDNFWLELGRATSIKYLDDVIIEHLHPAAGKAEWTQQYVEVNDQALYRHDESKFNEYMATQFQDDLRKLNG